MSAAIFRHIWLAMTFRHPLTGLPTNSFWLAASLFASSAVVCGVRWESTPFMVAHACFLTFLTVIFSPRIACAYALLSIGIDLVAIPVEAATETKGGAWPFGAWEAVGTAVIFWKGRPQ